MFKRTLSTLTLWALTIGATWIFLERGLTVLLVILATLTLWELYRMIGRMGHRPFVYTGLIIGALIMIAPVLEKKIPWISPEQCLTFGVLVCAVRIVIERSPRDRLETLTWTLLGLVYVPLMLQFLVRVLLIDAPHPRSGLALALWLLAVSKFCDVGALLTGSLCGRHKMSPVISPKKTWEGAAGGLLASAALGAGITALWPAYFPTHMSPLVAAGIAIPIAALGIIADLIESVIKRRANTKDSGNSIPGIGGMFDLADSLILTAPAGFWIFHLLS